MKRPLRIYTTCWGQHHWDWFERGLLKSLQWPKNRAALQHAIWTIYTLPAEVERAKALAGSVVPHNQVQVASILSLMKNALPTAHHFLLHSFVAIMHECLADGSQMLMAPPDTIFGEGSIPALLECGEQADTCVAVAHPRVDPTMLVSMDSHSHGPISNAELVSLAWENLHRSWSESESNRDLIGTYIGGVTWKMLSTGLIKVQHMLPTSYLCNFIADDLSYFITPVRGEPLSFGRFDHEWPGDSLVPKGRQRTIGSSDAVFIVELTDPNTNIPPLRHANPFAPDAFCRNLTHNLHNKQHVTIFRPAFK